jgi:hypothetical protein
MSQIIFSSPVLHVVVPEKTLPAITKTLTGLTITHMIDDPINKTVVVQTKEIGRIKLWEGVEYDNVGQWTDTDVINKILEKYS